jgi:hypothetical protein
MILKSLKVAVLTGVGLVVAGGILFGTELGSYARSSISSARTVVKDNVPVEFELKRARDLLDDIIPEMQANIRQIAQQEVEINHLRGDLVVAQKSLGEEQVRVAKLRTALDTHNASYTFGGLKYSREQLKEELARRFDRYKEAEVVLAGKRRLLENREKSLVAAVQVLDRTRGQKSLLEDQIESLEAQFRLVQASQVGSKLAIDNSKLAQTEKLISQIKKQLDVAERVLAHEAKFTETIQVDVVDEKELVAAVDEHFSKDKQSVEVSEVQPCPADDNGRAVSQATR